MPITIVPPFGIQGSSTAFRRYPSEIIITSVISDDVIIDNSGDVIERGLI